ncbi:MAG: MBL fold metallo-hydrolase [Gammaproteobacteria bacterium]|nr:MBL fold metallo-hydrolase [Gammaproteobacteria bacterium]
MSTQTYPQFLHHGAADGVTGSCHRYLASPELHLLIDCGLFQGVEAGGDERRPSEIEFDISLVRALVVTHVHIDHVGRLPYLLAAGFKGPIFCSIPSARLLPLVIEDALKLGFTRDARLIENFLATVQQQLMPLNYNQWYVMVNQDLLKLKVRLQMAGHILGSAYVELDMQWRDTVDSKWTSHRTVFSGDLGAPYAPLLPSPKAPYAADTLVIESTYGNRRHESRRERRLKLKALVERALLDGGTVLIPAFSIGRTQELLYEFEGIIHDVRNVGAGLARDGVAAKSDRGQGPLPHNKVDWSELQVIVDSPLAAKFTEVYRELKPFWDKEALQRVRAGRHPLDFETLLTIDSHEDHEKVVRHLAETKRPAIVIAASGMAAGGRIVNYLKAMIDDPVHCVLFVGYQVPGTPGHAILKHGAVGAGLPAIAGAKVNREQGSLPQVGLDGERYSIRAMVASIGGDSAHADQQNLLSFVRGMKRWPTQVRVVHGDDEARRALKLLLEAMAKRAGKEMEVLLPTRS